MFLWDWFTGILNFLGKVKFLSAMKNFGRDRSGVLKLFKNRVNVSQFYFYTEISGPF
jgi:hypothetical protein